MEATNLSPREFSFAAHAADFDRHISSSIRGYDHLRSDCVRFSQYFIQKNSRVIDIGCSSGEMLSDVEEYNRERFSSVQYIGLDIEEQFEKRWAAKRTKNIDFVRTDVTTFSGYHNLSVVYSLFTLQFLPERDRLPLVKAIYDGLNDGGAFILSEKVQAKNAKFQDILSFTYYDFKKENFTEQEILDKEHSIRDQMKLWSEFKIFEMLRSVGFSSPNLQLFWRNHLFIGIMAVKPAKFRAES